MTKFLLLIVCLLSVNLSYAAFSAHERITPENDQQFENYGLIFRVEPVKDLPDHVKITITSPKTIWLFVCEKPLAPDQQEFRNYIWNKKDDGKKILSEVILSHMTFEEERQLLDWKTKSATIILDKEIMKKAYLYSDYPNLVLDGGYYFTVDLSSYIENIKTNSDNIPHIIVK